MFELRFVCYERAIIYTNGACFRQNEKAAPDKRSGRLLNQSLPDQANNWLLCVHLDMRCTCQYFGIGVFRELLEIFQKGLC
jgi:hypothetical protein